MATDYDWRSVVSQPGQIQPYLRDVLSGDVGVQAAEKMAAGRAPISEFEFFGQPGNPEIPGGVEPDPNFGTSNFIESAYKNAVSGGGNDRYAPIWADVFRTLPGLTLDAVMGNAPTQFPDVTVPDPPAVNPFPFVLDVSVSGAGVVGEPVFATVTHMVPGAGELAPDTPLPIMLQSFKSGTPYRTTIIGDAPGSQTEIAVTPESAGEITVGAMGSVLGGGNQLPCTAVRYLNNEFGNGVLSSYQRDGEITFGSVQSALSDLQSGAITLTEFGIVAEAVDRCSPTGTASPPSTPTTTSAPVQIAPEGEPAPTPTPDESELSVELTNLEPVGFSDVRATFEVQNTVTSGAGEVLSSTARILVDGQLTDTASVTAPAGETRERTQLLTDLADTEREVEVCVELQ